MRQDPGLLLLFDIDGTLVLTGRAGMRAMQRTFADLFGVDDAFAGVPTAGRTDSYLVSAALQRAGLPDSPDEHRRFREAYVPRLSEEILQPGTGFKGVMPGVRELLAAASADARVHVGLLTGNYRDAALVKLSYFALWDFFPWGAFSDDAADRNALVPIAQARALEHGVERVVDVRHPSTSQPAENAVPASGRLADEGDFRIRRLARHLTQLGKLPLAAQALHRASAIPRSTGGTEHQRIA